MAITNPLSISRTGGFLGIGQGTNYDYSPTEYNPYAAYQYNASPLLGQAQGVLSQQMTGKLSDSTQQLLNQQFSQNLAATREGAYGMPLGAQMGLESKAATENALSAAQLAEAQRNWAVQNALPYEQFNAQQQQKTYDTGSSENRFGQQWNQQQADNMAQYSMQNKAPMSFGDILGAGISTFTGGLAGGLASGLVGNITGGLLGGGGQDNSYNDMENQVKRTGNRSFTDYYNPTRTGNGNRWLLGAD